MISGFFPSFSFIFLIIHSALLFTIDSMSFLDFENGALTKTSSNLITISLVFLLPVFIILKSISLFL
jgi:hypothetical protein